MTKTIDFDEWKAEYEPRVYLDMECDDHEECDCEFLYTHDLSEIDSDEYEDEDSLRRAIDENRVWTWDNIGIRSGVDNQRSELLVTKKPWTEKMEVI